MVAVAVPAPTSVAAPSVSEDPWKLPLRLVLPATRICPCPVAKEPTDLHPTPDPPHTGTIYLAGNSGSTQRLPSWVATTHPMAGVQDAKYGDVMTEHDLFPVFMQVPSAL